MTRKERFEAAHVIAETLNRKRTPFENWATLRDEVNWRTDDQLGWIELDILTDMVNARLTNPAPA